MTDPFVEIEIGGGSGEANPYLSVPLKPANRAHRDRFNEMREIARHRSLPKLDFNAVFYNAGQRDALALIFLRQARFMADFTDDYDGHAAFSSYYPVYQMMSYEQLRTYFTWRARVREGHVAEATVSCAFLYLYELINQIGINESVTEREAATRDGGSNSAVLTRGLRMIMDFWKAYRRYGNALDKHVIRWLKDYHIYYGLPGYASFVKEHGLPADASGYVNMDDDADRFAFYNAVSSYNVTDGGYYGAENAELLRGACLRVIDELNAALTNAGGDFGSLLFPSAPNKLIWKPFAHALFVCDPGRPESLTVLTNDEIYIYRRQLWTCRTVKHGNRRLVGYLLKKTEEALRRLTKHKRLLTAELNMLGQDTLRTLQLYGIYPDIFIEERVAAFYAEKTKIVVSVDRTALAKIREEALETQERLTVDEAASKSLSLQQSIPEALPDPPDQSDIWPAFINSLTQTEAEALRVVLRGGSLKEYADARAVMAEVLTDGINEKAVDTIGDTVIEYDGQATVYEEYADELKNRIITTLR